MTTARSAGKMALTTLLLLAVVLFTLAPASAQVVLPGGRLVGATNGNSPVGNFSAAIGRLVTLAAAAGGGLLSLVWARVALSWFSHDSMKKVLAKERARDALIGTLLFVGAVSGLVWALANWVVTGT
ncbi:MAG TPA: hypothetical protein VKT21_00025 [Thermoplasmata archaeon]|nr:hypothetical protein [Thermoplasmata archaeon]